MKIEIGKSYKIYDCHKYKAHVLAIIEGHIVYKYYGIYKQWWHYEIVWQRSFEFYIKSRKQMDKK